MDNLEPVIFTSRDMYTQDQIGPLLDELVKAKVITLVAPSGSSVQAVMAIAPYKLEDIESAIAAYADGSLPLEGGLIVARNDLLGKPHDDEQDDGKEVGGGN